MSFVPLFGPRGWGRRPLAGRGARVPQCQAPSHKPGALPRTYPYIKFQAKRSTHEYMKIPKALVKKALLLVAFLFKVQRQSSYFFNLLTRKTANRCRLEATGGMNIVLGPCLLQFIFITRRLFFSK